MKRPTVKEIALYMVERDFNVQSDEYGILVDKERKPLIEDDQDEIFFDHFESKGWMIGKSKMKCWKAATRNWIRNAKKWSKTNEKRQQPNQTHSQRQHQQAQDAHLQMELEHTESNARFIR